MIVYAVFFIEEYESPLLIALFKSHESATKYRDAYSKRLDNEAYVYRLRIEELEVQP